METKMIEIKAAVTTAIAAASAVLGVKGMLLLVWVVAMIADYASGYISAKLNDEWKSEKARTGAGHKFGMVLVVAGSAMADMVLKLACMFFPELGIEWHAVALPFMLIWYILTEIGSIFENAEKMGADIPSWLTTGLKIGLKAINRKAGGEEEKE